ncbi:hypothetical protein PPERSA_07190 [Pseudocohnilembus persalinus]|uniref:SAC3/GANP/THP3 conserved domain-containing protein n=1 Tax=Pseudocohnilembus persalinus TaxID=266149 RepID=A0A0V0QXA2_PSEPJ|nr:hypothetical protein PPERSA_07190 [Pseudocohnilembus persalinus]|eukprot:KRX07027.1 hypothetical protein PPERSA_07190 [Pseudocohnilembus persalinus]
MSTNQNNSETQNTQQAQYQAQQPQQLYNQQQSQPQYSYNYQYYQQPQQYGQQYNAYYHQYYQQQQQNQQVLQQNQQQQVQQTTQNLQQPSLQQQQQPLLTVKQAQEQKMLQNQVQSQDKQQQMEQEKKIREQREKQLLEQLQKQQASQKNKNSTIQQANGNSESRWNKPLILTKQMYQNLSLDPPEIAVDDTPEFPSNQSQQDKNSQQDQNQQQSEKEEKISIEGKWPEPVQDYIKRSFQKCKTQKDQNEIYKVLPQIITASNIAGDFLTRDWANFQLPMTSREKLEENMKKMQQQQEQMKSQQQQLQVNQLSQFNQKNFISGQGLQQPQFQQQQQQQNQQFQQPLQQTNYGDINLQKRSNPYVQENNLVQVGQQKKVKENNNNNNGIGKNQYLESYNKMKNQNLKMDLKYQKYQFKEKQERNIVGINQNLTKTYVRSMQEPEISEIRPEQVLKKSLKHILTKWKNQEVDYNYMQDQFRSIRQDLVVQRIKNEFTVKVCEHNARICIEGRDILQFLECCTTLFELYNEGVQGNQEEFLSYKMVYHQLQGQKLHVNKYISQLQSRNINDPHIEFYFEQ